MTKQNNPFTTKIKTIFLPKLPSEANIDVVKYSSDVRKAAIAKREARKDFSSKLPPLSTKLLASEIFDNFVGEQQSKVAAQLAKHAFKVKPEIGEDWAARLPTYPTGFHAYLQSLLCSIQCSVRNVYRAIALGNVGDREASFYELNSQVLNFYRKLSINRVEYIDHQDVACSDHFIAPHLRAYGKRKTGAALQRAQAWHQSKLNRAAKSKVK